MSWKEILKATEYSVENPIQTNPAVIARTLRADINSSKIHAGVNKFVPLLELYALKDKSRANRYKDIAAQLRKIMVDIRTLVTEYEK